MVLLTVRVTDTRALQKLFHVLYFKKIKFRKAVIEILLFPTSSFIGEYGSVALSEVETGIPRGYLNE